MHDINSKLGAKEVIYQNVLCRGDTVAHPMPYMHLINFYEHYMLMAIGHCYQYCNISMMENSLC